VAARAVPALKKTLVYFFRCSRSLPLTLFCRLSGEATENTFSFVKKKVSGILQEFLKQKLSALHASSAVRVCQLLQKSLFTVSQNLWMNNKVRGDEKCNLFAFYSTSAENLNF